MRPRRQACAGGQYAGRELPVEGRVAPRVPAAVELAAITRDPVRGRVMRRMARAGGEVAEERPVRIDRTQVAEVLDRAIRKIRAEVTAVVDGAGRGDRVVVVVERGHELVRLAAVEPVPPVEAARERPGRA